MKILLIALAATGFLYSDTEEEEIAEAVEYETDANHEACYFECITPPARPMARCGYGVFVTVEPLYWRITEEGLAYASTGSYNILPYDPTPAGASSTEIFLNLTNGETRHPEFKWDWGFRLGAGYDTPYDGWDLYSTWTHFHSKADDHVRRDADPSPNDLNGNGGIGDFVSPFWVAQLFSPPGMMNEGAADWKLHLDLLDLELGRQFYVSNYLTLRPFIGIRSGWIEQKFDLFFLRFNFPDDPTTVQRQISVDMNNRFWGIGARAGLNTQWFVGCGLSIYGNAAFSFLDGNFKTRYFLTDQQLVVVPGNLRVPTPPFDNTFENKNHVLTDVSMADITIGLRWETSIDDDQFNLAFWAGYEQNIFFDQNRFMNFQNDFTLINEAQQGSNPNFFTEKGNLVARGLTLGMEFGF